MFFLTETHVKICLTILVMVFTGLLVVQPAYAQDREPHGKKIMRIMDTDKDGKISREEFTRHHDKKFAKADTDKDGKLSSAEMKKLHEHAFARMDKHKMKHKDGRMNKSDPKE